RRHRVASWHPRNRAKQRRRFPWWRHLRRSCRDRVCGRLLHVLS
ncbi:hypothetical protein MUK42_26584, partial [Musa troglodytarum]